MALSRIIRGNFIKYECASILCTANNFNRAGLTQEEIEARKGRYKPDVIKEDKFEKGVRERLKSRRKKHWEESLPSWESEDALVKHLLDNKIYEDKHMIMLNKPTGLPMTFSTHEADRREGLPPGTVLSLQDVLPRLMTDIGTDWIRPVLSQPKFYSGIVIYAKSIEASHKFRQLFKHYRINKIKHLKHWALVHGPVKANEGNVRFPMVMFEENGERLFDSVQHTQRSQRAIKSSGKNSLLEFEVDLLCETKLKRPATPIAVVEMNSFVLKWESHEMFMALHHKSPVLGDHRYSHRVITLMGKRLLLSAEKAGNHRQAQILPENMMKLLQLKSEPDVIHTPLHMHGYEVILPKGLLYRGREEIEKVTFRAPLPQYFKETLLKIGVELSEIENTAMKTDKFDSADSKKKGGKKRTKKAHDALREESENSDVHYPVMNDAQHSDMNHTRQEDT